MVCAALKLNDIPGDKGFIRPAICATEVAFVLMRQQVYSEGHALLPGKHQD